MAAIEAELKSRFGYLAALERAAIDFLDDIIAFGSDNRAKYTDIYKKMNAPTLAREIRDHIGASPSAIAAFIKARKYLWQQSGEEILMLPTFLRAAIVDLVTSIVKNKNRAALGDILFLLQTYHRQALPYFPPPTNGNSVETVKELVLKYPELFRLVNAADGNEWTRVGPLNQVVVECVSVAVEGVIILNVKLDIPVTPTKSTNQPAPNGQPAREIRGMAEIVRITPAWGFIKHDQYGAIFFTSAACGGDNLAVQRNLKSGSRVYFEAKYAADCTQSYENAPVKWRAYTIRPLTAAEREAYVDGLRLTAAANATEIQAASASAASSNLGQSSSTGSLATAAIQQTSSPTSSTQSTSPGPKSDQYKRMPAALADWFMTRQGSANQQGRPNSATNIAVVDPMISASLSSYMDMQAELQAIEDELDIEPGNGFHAPEQPDEYAQNHDGVTYDVLEMELENQHNFQLEQAAAAAAASAVMNGSPIRNERQMIDVASSMTPPRRTESASNTTPRMNATASVASYRPAIDQRDAAMQTEVTDEELLLRLLRTAPELLDMVQVVMRR